MAILGDSAAPGGGSWFDVAGNKQYWTTNQFTMPAGGGIASDINVYCGGDGAAVTGRLVVWDSVGNIFYQTGNITIPSRARGLGAQAWVTSTAIAGTYLPAGNYLLGFWSSGHVVWTSESTGGVTGRAGLASPSTATGGTEEYQGLNSGRLGAYITYSPGGIARIQTNANPATPTWTVGVVSIQTNANPATPTWTPARVRVNQGTPGVPNWVDAT